MPCRTQGNPNAANIDIIADLYAEVIGVLAQSRYGYDSEELLLPQKLRPVITSLFVMNKGSVLNSLCSFRSYQGLLL